MLDNVWKFVYPYKAVLWIAGFLMIVEILAELLQPFLMAKIINDGVQEKNLEVVMVWGAVMLGLSFLALGAGILNSFYAAHASQSFGYDVRKNIFQKVQSFSYSQFFVFDHGSIMTRLTNDIQQLQMTIFMLMRIMLRAPILVIGGMLMAFLVQPKLALWLAVVVPVLFVFLLYVMNKGSRMFKNVQKKLDNVNNVMDENLSGMKLIRAYERREFEESRFNAANEHLKERTVSVLRFMEVTMPSLVLLMNVAVIFILWFGHEYIAVGGANVGEVVAVVNYATRITSSLSIFSFIIMAFSRANASASRLNEVLRTPVEMTENVQEVSKVNVKGDLSFEHVTFHYRDQQREALKDLSFNLKSGETLAILGATGSGKTTIVNLIPRLYDPNAGVVKIDGVDVKEYHPKALRQNIGIVPQVALLFTGTIKENILWGKQDATDGEIVEACKKAQIYETITQYSKGMETLIGQKGVNLSGGQRQRLAIARALVRRPSILLLDDSTSALDVKTEERLLQALKNEPSTKVIVTQKISTAVHADRIILLEDGEKVAEGQHDELCMTSSLYREIVQSQLEKEGGVTVVESIK